MTAEVAQREIESVAVPLTLHFEGAIPSAGLDAEEVAAVADGMARVIQFIAERADDSGREYVLHLTAVRPGSTTFQFFLEAAAIVQSALPAVFTDSGFTIKQAGEIFSHAVKLLEFLNGKPPEATAKIDGSHNVQVTNSQGVNTIVYSPVYNITGNTYFQEQVGRSVRPLRKRASALTHSDATGNLAILARMEAAEAVQMKGFGSALRSSR